jgi:hypothetical protein
MPRTDPPHRGPGSLATVRRRIRRLPKRKGDGAAGAVPVSPDPRPSLIGGAAVRPDEG